jgi:hypothetical protein
VPPTLYDVLAGVRRAASPTSARPRSRSGSSATTLDVLRHLLGARAERRDPERFPLTEAAFQAVARKLGHHVGQKKSRRLVARLLEAGVVVGAGNYRQPYRDTAVRSGFRVALFALARRQRRGRSATSKRPVGKSRRRQRKQRRRWWLHPLFGDMWGLRHRRFQGATWAGCAHWTRFFSLRAECCHRAGSAVPQPPALESRFVSRTLALLLTSLGAAVALAGCGSNGPEAGSAAATTTPQAGMSVSLAGSAHPSG